MKLTNESKRERGIPLAQELRVVKPGQSITITDEDRDHMLRFPMVNNWLDRGEISITGGKGKNDPKQRVSELPEDITGTGFEIAKFGGGWCMPYMNGEPVTDRRVRKAEAEAMAKDYGG